MTGFPKIKRGRGGRVITAVVKGTSGKASVSGSELKSAVSAWDSRLWVNKNKNIVGTIRAKYDSLMCKPGPAHLVGRRRWPGGARQKFQVGGIYRNSAAGVSVWLRGAIYKEYVGAGGATGQLGLPSTQVKPVPGTPGERILFKGGRIYAKGGAGTHALWGKVLGEYLDRGAATGSLGFPTSRVHSAGGRHHRDVRARHHHLRRRRRLLGVLAVAPDQHAPLDFGSGALLVHTNASANPFAMVRACAAVTLPGQVSSLFHAVRASDVPSGRSGKGAINMFGCVVATSPTADTTSSGSAASPESR